jgi:hypothetical protein
LRPGDGNQKITERFGVDRSTPFERTAEARDLETLAQLTARHRTTRDHPAR